MIESTLELDEKRQAQARQYARQRRRLWLAGMALDGLYVIVWLQQGWAFRLREVLSSTITLWWVVLLVLAGMFAIPLFFLSLPLNVYSSYILPRRYELSTQTLHEWFIDLVKGGLLSLVIGLPLLISLYAVMRAAISTWWLWAAVGYSLVSVVLAAIAPVVLMPIFFKFQPLGDDHADLVDRLLNLAKKAQTQVRGVFTFDMSRRTRTANAGLVGLGRTRRILVGDTMLEAFSTDEIETVLAHELAHHVHRDIPLSIVVQSGVNFAMFYVAALGMELASTHTALTAISDPAGLPILAFLLGALNLLVMPLANAFSRWRESLADDYVLEVTEKGKAYASALTRLANQNLAEIDPERWVVLLLYSHPPLARRIERAMQIPE